MAEAYTKSGQVGLIVLAAGQSSRLQKPKQLLQYKGQSLVVRSAQAALGSALGPVIVVVGAYEEEMKNALSLIEVEAVFNRNWQEGMAASIRTGIEHLSANHSDMAGAILLVCDQPFVSAELLQLLVSASMDTGQPIVTCSYGDSFGPPTFFHKTFFPELLQLKGDVGARSILNRHPDQVVAIPFPEGKVDIDTETDYQQVLKRDGN